MAMGGSTRTDNTRFQDRSRVESSLLKRVVRLRNRTQLSHTFHATNDYYFCLLSAWGLLCANGVCSRCRVVTGKRGM